MRTRQLVLFCRRLASRIAAAFADAALPEPAKRSSRPIWSADRSRTSTWNGRLELSAECTGIVKTRDGSKMLDNLAIHCLEEAKARPEGYAFTGTCIQADGDGDKLYMTYEGPEGGDIALLGGTGKYQGITGKGTWTVADAPGNTATCSPLR